MAHHVIQYPTTLKLTLPEPRPVRPAVLLGGPGEIGAASERRAAGPEEAPSVLDLGSEHLVLQVPVIQAAAFDERDDAGGLGDRAGEGLLAGDSRELSAAAADRVGDLLNILQAGEIGPAEPDRVDARVRDHGGDRRERLGGSDIEAAGEGRGIRRVLRGGAP